MGGGKKLIILTSNIITQMIGEIFFLGTVLLLNAGFHYHLYWVSRVYPETTPSDCGCSCFDDTLARGGLP